MYTLRLAVDDAVLVSEMKRQHKVVVGSRAWSNCRNGFYMVLSSNSRNAENPDKKGIGRAFQILPIPFEN